MRRCALLAVVLLATGCRYDGPVRRFLRSVDAAADVAAWLCPMLFAFVFVGGGIAALVKTKTHPTERSRNWARRLALVNALVGSLFLLSVALDPPRIVSVTMGPTGETQEVAGPDGMIVLQPVYAPIDRREGKIDLGSLLPLIMLGMFVAGVGIVGFAATRQREAR